MFKARALLVAMVLPLSLPAGEPTAKDVIRKVLDDQVKAWNRGDLPGFMEGYWKSPELTFYSGNNVTQGWEATLERYRKKYQADGKEMGRLSFTNLTIDVLGADHAVVRGRFSLQLKSQVSTGLFTLIVRKLAPGWRITHDHTSN